MVNQTNKQTFDFPLVGEVCNLAGVECPINSKVYHSFRFHVSFSLTDVKAFTQYREHEEIPHRMPPRANVIQGMDLVYSQTKSCVDSQKHSFLQ